MKDSYTVKKLKSKKEQNQRKITRSRKAVCNILMYNENLQILNQHQFYKCTELQYSALGKRLARIVCIAM